MSRITLYGRQGCHLCDDARSVVSKVTGELGLGFTETDVDTDPELRGEYGDRVPVLLIDGVEHGYGRIDPARLRRALTT
ncbi:MAG: glutaredoxin family protein [Mycobacteriales bacterium]